MHGSPPHGTSRCIMQTAATVWKLCIHDKNYNVIKPVGVALMLLRKARPANRPIKTGVALCHRQVRRPWPKVSLEAAFLNIWSVDTTWFEGIYLLLSGLRCSLQLFGLLKYNFTSVYSRTLPFKRQHVSVWKSIVSFCGVEALYIYIYIYIYIYTHESQNGI